MFDQDAIKELTKAEAITAAASAISQQADELVALPCDFNLHDLEKYQSVRRRARGTMTSSAIPDFAAYALTHKEDGASVFIDQDRMTATAVLNLGTPTEPGHADNIAKLAPKKTAAYAALLQHAGGNPMKQSTVAEFLEDWGTFITCHNEEGPIELKKAVAAVRIVTIESLRKGENSEQSLSASRSTFESVTASSREPLPTQIVFSTDPYVGLSYRRFVLRLGVQTGGDKPTINLRIINAEQHAEQMAEELAQLVREALQDSMPALVGGYQAAN